MAITAFAYHSKREPKANPVSIAINALQIKEAQIAGQNDAQHITDPMQLQGIIDDYKSLLTSGLLKTPSDKQQVEETIARKSATLESLKQDESVQSITSALNFDTKDARYLYANRFANSPVAYLKAFNDSYTALQQVGQNVVDQMNSQGKTRDADALSKLLKTYNPISDTYKSISPFYEIDPTTGMPKVASKSAGSYIDENGKNVDIPATDQLKGYAVVYQTDTHGRVKDMKVLPVDQVPDGFVPVVDGRDFTKNQKGKQEMNPSKGNNVTMDGMQVFLNKQNVNGKDFVALGSKQQVPVSSSSPVAVGNAISLDGTTRKMAAALLQGDNQNLDDPTFRKTIIPADPAINTTPGEYFKFADGRVFRNNNNGKLDEIAPDALQYFQDYNPSNAIRVPTIDSANVYGRSGKLIRGTDFNMSMVGGGAGSGMLPVVPDRTLQPNASIGPTPSPAPEAAAAGPMSMAAGPMSVAPKTNRPVGPIRPNGTDQFNQSTQKLFSGVPRP